MGNKILIQDLIEKLATDNHLSKNVSDNFVKTFFDTIVSVLEKEKNVKIKGLGTFKLVDVDSRESVNVNTGERIRIEGHQKVAFIPETALKQRINKPFEQFETVVINDGVDIDSMESLDNQKVAAISQERISGDENQPESEVVEKNSSTEKDGDSSISENTGDNSIKEEDSETDVSDSVQDTPINNTTVPESPATASDGISEKIEHVVSPMQMQVEIKKNEEEEKAKKQAEALAHERNENRRLRVILLLLIAVILCLVSYFAGYYKVLCPGCDRGDDKIAIDSSAVEQKKTAGKTLSSAVDSSYIDSSAISRQVTREEERVPKSDLVETEKTLPKEKELQKKVSSVSFNPDVAYRMVSTQAVHEMKAGENLYLIAQKYYGSKKFATYIIRYNGFDNPDVVPIGTRVKIPHLKE